MKLWIWGLIVVGGLTFIIFLIKFLTRGKGEEYYSSSSNSFFDKVKDACCKIKERLR